MRMPNEYDQRSTHPEDHRDAPPGAPKKIGLRDLTPADINRLTKALAQDVLKDIYLYPPEGRTYGFTKIDAQEAIRHHINSLNVVEKVKAVFRRRVTVDYIRELSRKRTEEL